MQHKPNPVLKTLCQSTLLRLRRLHQTAEIEDYSICYSYPKRLRKGGVESCSRIAHMRHNPLPFKISLDSRGCAKRVRELTFNDTVPTTFQIQPPQPRHPSRIPPPSKIRLLDQARIPYPTGFRCIRHLGFRRICRARVRMEVEDQAESLSAIGACRARGLVDEL